MSERNVTPNKFNLPIKPVYIVLIIVGIIILSGAFTTVYTIDETERGVLLRLGKIKDNEVGPGLHAKIPFGIDKLYRVPVLDQTLEFGYETLESGRDSTYAYGDYSAVSEMLTGDLNIINVEWSIIYYISNPENYLFNVEDPIRTIKDISQSVVNRLVGDTAVLAVIGSERDRIGVKAQEEMKRILSQYNIGIDIRSVQLQSTKHASPLVQAAFEDVNAAEQDMNTLINEGKAEYEKVRNEVKGQAEKIIHEANAYSNERVNKAYGDVARFVAVRDEWLKNPEVTEKRLYIEMWEEVFIDSAGTELIDKNLSDNVLPLMNIQGVTQ